MYVCNRNRTKWLLLSFYVVNILYCIIFFLLIYVLYLNFYYLSNNMKWNKPNCIPRESFKSYFFSTHDSMISTIGDKELVSRKKTRLIIFLKLPKVKWNLILINRIMLFCFFFYIILDRIYLYNNNEP